MTVLQLSIRLLLFVGAGFLGRKFKAIPDGFDRMLSRFVMAIPLPCMILSSFNLEYSVDNLLAAPLLIALSVGSMLGVGALVWLSTGWMPDPAMKKTVRFALLFTNFTFVGFPVVQELYGPEGFFIYVLFTLPIRLVFYGGASVLLGVGGEKIDKKETLKRFLCEPVIAVFLGFFLYAFRIQLPEVLRSTVQTIGSMASPLGLMLCGAVIADADFKEALKNVSVLAVTFCRLLVIPGLVILVFRLLGVQSDFLRSSVFYFAMPVASLTPAFLLRYDPDAMEARVSASYMVVVSMLLCVATIPLWAIVLERLL